MTASNRPAARFNFLTVLVWLLVAGGICLLLWQVIARISGSNLPVSTATPNQSQVYRTIAAIITAQGASTEKTATPTITPTPSLPTPQNTSIPYPLPPSSSTPGGVVRASATSIPCNQAAAGKPIDLTIPDDSLITPGLSFTKTWKLVNNGSCTWTTSYYASFFYGDRMQAPETVALQENVPPAQSVEISVDMIAPLSPGTYQGNWKLSDPNGLLFGIGPTGDSPFWVRIIVPENPTNTEEATQEATFTPSPTGSPTVTPTASPVITITATTTASPMPSPTATATPAPSATASSTPAFSPTPSSTPAPSPTSTATITPTLEANSSLIELELGAYPNNGGDLPTWTAP